MPRIIYVAGWMRSGTTLLSEVLDSFDNSLAVGELSGIFNAAAKNHQCSCGLPISNCPLWSPVLDQISIEFPEDSFASLSELSKRVLSTKNSLALARLKSSDTTNWSPDHHKYTRVLNCLIESICKVSGCETIVDSSKLPPQFLFYCAIPSIQADLVHIYRDPRAVAYSESQTRTQPSINPELTPPGKHPFRSVLLWMGANFLTLLVAKLADTSALITYEDLVRDTEATRHSLMNRFKLDWSGSDMTSGHIAVGNPKRMLGSSRGLKLDTRWESKMPTTQKIYTGLMALPVWFLLRTTASS